MFMSSMDMSSQAEFERYQHMKTRDQIKHTLKDMGSRSYSTAKNFALVGAIFASSECVIETYRAKNDMYNGITAGCFTGATLAVRGGPKAMATGCVGFAAFSAAIGELVRIS
ncbi:mitochondrial inner membrane translocase subunit Tim17/Tim22/Tim23/peroxisomal protein PMP24 [Chytriomyces sp. MP71]|nr:mitochondrial inner membrane translocase subunit Tim17/Tim22/Tim23/peroxisomal protein PMP24 [Chytriomyces sp. MP71]